LNQTNTANTANVDSLIRKAAAAEKEAKKVATKVDSLIRNATVAEKEAKKVATKVDSLIRNATVAERHAKKVEAVLRHNEATAKGTAKSKAELLVKSDAKLRQAQMVGHNATVESAIKVKQISKRIAARAHLNTLLETARLQASEESTARERSLEKSDKKEATIALHEAKNSNSMESARIKELLGKVLAEKGLDLAAASKEGEGKQFAKQKELALHQNEAFAKGTAKSQAELLVKTDANLHHTVLPLHQCECERERERECQCGTRVHAA
jgi:hypothetical protein